jgi:hypothetical protein
MNRTWRTIIFFSFLLMFLISAPVVVLYTAGYRLDTTSGRITHTGVLNIKTIPRGATVLIDEEKESDRTPSVFDNVFPGKHTITLQRSGYTTWEKTLEIKSRETTFIIDALLFLQSNFDLQDQRDIVHYTLSPNQNQLAYLVSEGSWIELWITETNTQSERLLARITKEDNANYELHWSAKGNTIALLQNGVTLNTLSLVTIATGTTLPIPTILKNASRFWWDVAEDRYLYVEQSGIIYRADVQTQEVESVSPYAETIMHPDDMFVLSPASDRMVLSRIKDGTATILTYLPIGVYQFRQAPNNLALIEDINRHRIILVDLSGQDQPILLNEGAVDWDWNDDHNRLVFTDGYDLEVYTRNSHTTQTLTRQSDRVHSVRWYPLGNAVLYSSETTLNAIELDMRDGHEVTELASGAIQTFWLHQGGKQLSVLATQEEITGIFSRKIQR